jgi:hypothetical protein
MSVVLILADIFFQMKDSLNPDWMGAFLRAYETVKALENLLEMDIYDIEKSNPPMIELLTGFRRLKVLSWGESPPDRQDSHRRLTKGAYKGRPRSSPSGLNQNLQYQLNKAQQLFRIAVQKAVVSHAAKAFR